MLLTANASPRTYWIQALSQYRPGSPSGYGFLTYSNSNVSALPPTPTPASNGTDPWTLQQLAEVRSFFAFVSMSTSCSVIASPVHVSSDLMRYKLRLPSQKPRHIYNAGQVMSAFCALKL